MYKAFHHTELHSYGPWLNSAAAPLPLCGSSMKYAWHEPPPENASERKGEGCSTVVKSEWALEDNLSQ